jgi:hypothetical protein
MSRAQLLKSLIKGTDISEDASLDKYLLSRGINPQFATKDQKVAHSKTTQFINWKRNRMLEDTLEEKVDKKDTVTLDIPLLIRVLELAREDIKTDMDLHRVVEKLINIRNKGMLTMKDYNYIAKIHEEVFRENHIAVAMGKEIDDEGSMIMNQLDQMEHSINMMRDVVKDPKMQVPAWVQSKVTLAADYIETVAGYMSSKTEEVEGVAEGIEDTIASFNKNRPAYAQAKVDTRTSAERKADTDKMLAGRASAKPKVTPKPLEKKTPEQQMKNQHDAMAKSYASHKPGQYVGDSVEHDDTTMVEAQSAALRFQKALQREKTKREEQERKDVESKARAEKLLNPPKPVKEDKFQDSMAASQTVGMEVDNPSDAEIKSQRSKSARIIKSLYKRKNMKEELYDHEKEDKPTTSYGKKPKISVTKPTDSVGENKPDAAAVLTGGKTLTGQTRDTIEIDPMMKKRPGSDPTGKNK